MSQEKPSSIRAVCICADDSKILAQISAIIAAASWFE
jgi:hypothetical protein